MMIQKGRTLHLGQTAAATGRPVDMHAVQQGYSILCLDAQKAYFHAEEDEDVYCWPPREWVNRYHARGGRVESPWWKLKRQLCGRRKASKKFNEAVVTATDGLGIEHCPEQPSLFRRPGTTLIFECHQDDFYVSGSNVELAWPQENLAARLKLKPAEPTGPGSQWSYLRAMISRINAAPSLTRSSFLLPPLLPCLLFLPPPALRVVPRARQPDRHGKPVLLRQQGE